jgi:hypothetical protein
MYHQKNEKCFNLFEHTLIKTTLNKKKHRNIYTNKISCLDRVGFQNLNPRRSPHGTSQKCNSNYSIELM